MHICYVADARSPIAKNWISYLVTRNHQVTVISSYPCALDEIPGARIIQFPIALSSLCALRPNPSSSQADARFRNRILSELRGGKLLAASQQLRTWIAPIDIRRKTRALSAVIDDLRPDVVHAMRLPFEGFIAAASVKNFPLLLSVWGNDFTLFANRSRRLAALTQSALQRADGLHCDCNRDLNLALIRGFRPTKPWRVLPGNGGIHSFFFHAGPDAELLRQFRIPNDAPLVINPRGFRSYVHNESFFRAIPLVLRRIPGAVFLATGMLGHPTAERWIRRTNIAASVRLLPTVSREQLASLFATARVSVSLSSHDGTPNTLLEAMAAGCLPVVGNIDSLREWIVDGENGLMCDPRDPEAIAARIVRALGDSDLRSRANGNNRSLVGTRAGYRKVMENAERFYEEVLNNSRGTREFQPRGCHDCADAELTTRQTL